VKESDGRRTLSIAGGVKPRGVISESQTIDFDDLIPWMSNSVARASCASRASYASLRVKPCLSQLRGARTLCSDW
jgi:hypothetical protein